MIITVIAIHALLYSPYVVLSIVFRMCAVQCKLVLRSPELIRQTFTLYMVTARRGSGPGQIKLQINPCLEGGGGGAAEGLALSFCTGASSITLTRLARQRGGGWN